MIYLDYAANTPVEEEVLWAFCEESRHYYGNPNSAHGPGKQAKDRMDEITRRIAKLLKAEPEEIIYTSGASESNNLALKGAAYTYRNRGKHIISTCLEHSSVSGALTALQKQGYEIDLVDITPDGQVDKEHLRELLRRDTILVSVSYVDSELGVVQPIGEIAEITKKQNCFFHTDATQAVGKVPFSLEGVDLLSFSPHKFFGINGSGILVRKKQVVLEPLIHGGASTTIYRSGTPALGLAASVLKALELAVRDQDKNYNYVKELNQYFRERLGQYKLVRINSTVKSIPHCINISVKGVKGSSFQKALAEHGVCVSVKSACSVEGTPSRPVYAVTRDKKNALSSFRISISHRTTKEEADEFFRIFEKCYKELVK